MAALAAADVPLLSTEEIEAAKAEARERVRAKKVKEAKAAIVAAEMKRIEREDGMKAGDADMDELVPILIDLPEFAPCLSLNIDDKFYHGHTYTLPRHVCNSLREQMARAWDHQNDVDGKSVAQKVGARRVRDFDKIPGQRVAA